MANYSLNFLPRTVIPRSTPAIQSSLSDHTQTVSAPANALAGSCNAFSTLIYTCTTTSSGKTKEELIEELSKDPEAKMILEELLRKEFDISKNNENPGAIDEQSHDLPTDSTE